MSINVNEIKRKGTYISLAKGITAMEGMEGNLPTLTIRQNSKVIKNYKGSSLGFNMDLTIEDKEYLKSLAES